MGVSLDRSILGYTVGAQVFPNDRPDAHDCLFVIYRFR